MTDDRVHLTTEQIMFIRQGAERLRHEFEGTFNVETIERYMLDSRGVAAFEGEVHAMATAADRAANRDRLRALERLELGADAKPAVLFLCVHNAGRSQMGAGWLRRLAGDRVDVFSGGTEPGIAMNDAVVAAMSEVGVDIAAELPQPWTTDRPLRGRHRLDGLR